MSMLKKYLIALVAMLILPVFAGDVENAIYSGHNVLLYLYSTDCSYCKMFSKNYDKLSKMYNGQYNFFKKDVATPYGHDLFVRYRGTYVPYVLLIRNNNAIRISPNCLLEMACVEKELKDFRK